MKLSNKLSLTLLITGTTALILLSFIIYKSHYNSLIKSQMLYSQSIANEVSGDFDVLLAEKVNTSRTFAHMPEILDALQTSNLLYTKMSEEKRNQSIDSQNSKWKSVKDPTDDFILKFTDNRVSHLLKGQQSLLKGEYGEIFLTNKFGALVASTAKLSTFAHGNKYWWQGAYHNGEGKIFFDDRGYDDSVGGYVLGLVVPVREGMETIGILKFNLNIMGSIDTLLSSAEDKLIGLFKLSRSGGMIVFDKGFEPLSTLANDSIRQKMQNNDLDTVIIEDKETKYLVGLSEVQLTQGADGYVFGGTFKSVDHKKGNSGESWYILCYRELNIVLTPLFESIKKILFSGFLLILLLALISYLFGRKLAQPLAILDKGTREIGKGNFSHQINLQSNDELGKLAHSFNDMATQLKQSTTSLESLEKSQAYLKSIFRVAPIGIGVTIDRVLQQVNDQMGHITGYQEEELIGQSLRMLYLNDEDFERVGHLKYNQIQNFGTATIEAQWRHRNGSLLDILLNLTPLDPDNLSKGITFTALDITSQKKMGEQLLQNEKLVTIAGLAAGVAHEINTPLSAILQAHQLVELGLSPQDADSKEKATEFNVDLVAVQKYFKQNELGYFMDGIRDSALKAGNIVKSLLDFSRPHVGTFCTSNLVEIIDNSLLLAQADYDMKKTQNIMNVHFVKECDSNLPPIICVPMEIEQVLLNLIKNSTQAMAAADMTSPPCITLRAAIVANNVLIEVEDNGPGITEAAKMHIFDPFFTTKDVGQGTGLGLSVSHTIIVDKHRGKIWAKSLPEQGTKISIELPLVQKNV